MNGGTGGVSGVSVLMVELCGRPTALAVVGGELSGECKDGLRDSLQLSGVYGMAPGYEVWCVDGSWCQVSSGECIG